jgi:hypothetical protein
MEEGIHGGAIAEPRPFTGGTNHYTLDDIEWIAHRFDIASPLTVEPFPGRGNINLHTYSVTAGGREFLLQKVNSDVFTMPHRVMGGMLASIEAQRRALESGRGDSGWEPIRLVPTREGEPYLDMTDEEGWSVWRMMIRIPASVSYKSLSEIENRQEQLALAEEVGRGLAIYSDLTADIDPSSVDGSLPGYRDTRLYFGQFHSAMACNRTLEQVGDRLPSDPILRASTEQHFLVALSDDEYRSRKDDPELQPFISLVKDEEPYTLGLWTALDAGQIRKTLIHGDTKIENFLFCSETGKVKSLVDLDTVMPFTWLADYGDMLRSLVNIAGEKETDLDKVVIDRDVYEAVSKGFLEAAKQVTDAEVDLMVFSVQAITLELGLRFLTDYLRGDTYFQLAEDDPRDLNKVRAMVQLTLFQRLREFEAEAKGRLAKYRVRA